MKKFFWREQIIERDIDTLKRQLREKLGGYTVSVSYITKENLLFRGVACNERPDKVHRISYPPAKYVTRQGRLNRVGQSIFYCSKAAPAIFYELQAKPEQCVALSTWELVQPLWMHNLGFHANSLRRIGAPIDVRRLRLTQPIKDETKFNRQLRRQLSEAFTEDVSDGEEYRYKLPIAINELLFDDAGSLPMNILNGPRSEAAAGTVYPTMRMRGIADNVAILPEFVDRRMRLKFVSYVLVEAMDVERSSYTVSSLAQSDEFVDGQYISGSNGSCSPTKMHAVA